ncbi:Glycoside hydrolase, family 76 [Cordyceps fumosorosea ARSEF 2679]|uniref:Glycoside hydrolase, family 76 n=1 Tax=Cordyceps fumosorosea (strain ARSEF 2679) TaxID=1081104 RepID=A0A168AN34_CORFA|nr:Glycoside hydrolase, family 76 [Cordyceps fumosorosea ARSEF 2679]OAA68965.1 Glycoside hydrolase, family 76 [Cordyceps fumosorosea ARSEF 2679]
MPCSSSWAASLLLALATHASAVPVSDASTDSLSGSLMYAYKTKDGVNSLNKNWYQNDTGLWGGWWNSGNALTTIGDFVLSSPAVSQGTNPYHIIANTFDKAQHVTVQTAKFMNFAKGGMMKSQYCINGSGACGSKRDGSLTKRGFTDFLNEFYDDEGWWALALIRAYDVTQEDKYLQAAVAVFKDMQTGAGTPCGGIYWSKERKYVNAIANELYLSVAASLANYDLPGQSSYLKIANDQWTWFSNSGMINSENLINDGLDDKCNNNGQQTWTYNQGVILGGLVQLFHATGNRTLLGEATKIAKAAINKLSNKDGVLVEYGGCEYTEGRCGADGQQFKGIFIRNLGYLHKVSPDAQFRSFILTNANAIWKKDREESSNKLGVAWAGPYYDATSHTQSSALDALVAAIGAA